MAEAWIQRGCERQQVQEKTHRDIFELDDKHLAWEENRYQACAYLGSLIINYLFGQQIPDSSLAGSYQRIAEDFFAVTVFPRYAEFSRAKEETEAMLAKLAVWLIEEHSLIQFQKALSRKEFSEPEVIFMAPSAMDEV